MMLYIVSVESLVYVHACKSFFKFKGAIKQF